MKPESNIWKYDVSHYSFHPKFISVISESHANMFEVIVNEGRRIFLLIWSKIHRSYIVTVVFYTHLYYFLE